MAKADDEIYEKFQDLVLDINLDQETACLALNNYELLRMRFVMEGDQLSWLLCAVYTACRERTLPTVGGQPGTTVNGNCISLTRMLHFCNITLMDFIEKMKLWLNMTHLGAAHTESLKQLESKYAVSNNIFRKYKPIFLDLFADPALDPPRPVRSRKQKRPPCNATELYSFCWTLYLVIKGKYPCLTQDLVTSYLLLLSALDLMYINVKCMDRTDLLNPTCEGYNRAHDSKSGWNSSLLPDSVIDYLCRKFEGILVETKVVRDFHLRGHIKTLVECKLLKGSVNGLSLLECPHLDHNIKAVDNAYDTDLLSSGEFDERLFITNDSLLGTGDVVAPLPTSHVTPMSHLPRRSGNLRPGDHHLLVRTPLSGRGTIPPSPSQQQTPMSAARAAMQKLYMLMRNRAPAPTPQLAEKLSQVSAETPRQIQLLLIRLGKDFEKLYCEGSAATSSLTASKLDFTASQSNGTAANLNNENLEPDHIESGESAVVPTSAILLRLRTVRTLYYAFLENIVNDECKRGVDIRRIIQNEIFLSTLFCCCLELVLMCYNDSSRKFPWSLKVGSIAPYYFFRVVELVVRADQLSDNRLSRDLVKHLKRIEEQVLDCLAWQQDSPLWQAISEDPNGVPSCSQVNFSDQLDMSSNDTPGQLLSPVVMSPATRVYRTYSSPRRSPLSSSACERLALQSPPTGTRGSVKRTLLFPAKDANSSLDSSRKVLQPQSEEPQASSSTVRPSSSSAQDGAVLPREDSSTSERPRRHGSLAIFFRKVYYLAHLRLSDLCDRLDIRSGELRRKIWTCLEYSIVNYTSLMVDRHLDQLIMCAIYCVCKVTKTDRTLREILKHYRCQPQADSHIYRSVLIQRFSPNADWRSASDTSTAVECVSDASSDADTTVLGSNLQPFMVNGTSTTFSTEERGDLIKFYNDVYVQKLKTFALKFKNSGQDGVGLPPLSPVPLLRATPVSPRRRVSCTRNVFVRSLSPATRAAAASPRQPLQYHFSRSPVKDLRRINSLMHFTQKRPLEEKEDTSSVGTPGKRVCAGINRRLNTVLDEQQQQRVVTTEHSNAAAGVVVVTTPAANHVNGVNGDTETELNSSLS